MNNIQTKDTDFLYDFKEGRLLRFAGILLPFALYGFLDIKYEFTAGQHYLFLGLYLLLHGLWVFFSKNLPIFTEWGNTNKTIIIKGKVAIILSFILIIAGLIYIALSF